MNYVYVVQGTTGQYSDRFDWIVKAFRTKEEADKFQQDITDVIEQLWKFSKKHDVDYYYFSDIDDLEASPEVKKTIASFYEDVTKLDPKFQCDYTGTSYWVTEVELAGTSNT